MNGTMVQNVTHHFSSPNSASAYLHSTSSPNNRTNSQTTAKSMSPPKETHLNGRKIGLNVEKWLISEIDRRRYGAVFRKIAGSGGKKVSGTQVRDYFVRFQLPQHVLRDIWEVADEQHEGELDEEHLAVALHLLERVLRYCSTSVSAIPAVKTHHPLSSGPTFKPPPQNNFMLHALNQQNSVPIAKLDRNSAVVPIQPQPPAPLRDQSHATPTKPAVVSSKTLPSNVLTEIPVRTRLNFEKSTSILDSDIITLPRKENLPVSTTTHASFVHATNSIITSSPLRVCSVVDSLPPTAVVSKSITSTAVSTSTANAVVPVVQKSPEKPPNSAEYERLLKQLDAKRKIRHGLAKRVEKLTQKLDAISNSGAAEQQVAENEAACYRLLITEAGQACESFQNSTRSAVAEIARLKAQRNLLENRKVQLVQEKSSAAQEQQMLRALQQTGNGNGQQPNYEPILHHKRQNIDLLNKQVLHAERLIQQRRAEVLRVEYQLSSLQTAMKADKQHNETLCAVYAGKQTQLRENLVARRRKVVEEKQTQERMRAAQAEQVRQRLLLEEERKRLEQFATAASAAKQQQQQEQRRQHQLELQNQHQLQHQHQQNYQPRFDADLFSSVNQRSLFPVPSTAVLPPPPPPETKTESFYDQLPPSRFNMPLSTTTALVPPIPIIESRSTAPDRNISPTQRQPPKISNLQRTPMRTNNAVMPPSSISSSPSLSLPNSANSSIRSASSISSSKIQVTPDHRSAVSTASVTAQPAMKPEIAPIIVRPAPPPPSVPAAAAAAPTAVVAPSVSHNSSYANIGRVESGNFTDSVYDVPKSLVAPTIATQPRPMYTNIGEDHFLQPPPTKSTAVFAPSPQPSTAGLLFVAVQNYTAVGDDELPLRVGDQVQVMVLHQDKWWYGKLVDSSSSSIITAGYFPASAVQRMSDVPVECTALYDFEARNEDELSFCAGERLILITANNASSSLWALAKLVSNDDSSRAGLVPVNYLSPPPISITSMSPQLEEESIPVDDNAYDREFDDDDESAYDTPPVSHQPPFTFDAEKFEQFKKRLLAVEELVSTEKTYNSFLHAVIQRFDELFGDVSATSSSSPGRKASSPMRNAVLPAQQRRSMSISHSNLTSLLNNNDEFDLLCSGWAELAHFSDMLLLNLNQQEPVVVNALCNAFIQLLPQMQNVYAEFCSRQIQAITLIRAKCQHSEQFDTAVRQFSATLDGLRGCTLEAAFVRPLERITRYPLLIKRILSHTTPDATDEYTSLTRALSAAEAACVRINEGVGERESSARLEWLNQHVQLRSIVCRGERLEDFSSPTNSMGPRQLLFFGTLFKSRSGKELVAFLFNDFLLLTTPSEAFKSPGQFSFESAVWRQQQLKPYKTPIMLDRMRVRAAASAADAVENATIYEVDELSHDRRHKSSSLSRKSSMRRRLSFDHASSLRGNATYSDLAVGGVESGGSANDIFVGSNSSENLSDNEFIVQSSDGLIVRLKAVTQNECRNWVKALRQAAATYSRRTNDMLAATRRAPVAAPSHQQTVAARCQMQIVAASGLKCSGGGGMALGAPTKTKFVCTASIGEHSRTSPAVECVANGGGVASGVCRWNAAFSLPFTEHDLNSSGEIKFQISNCCVFRPDRVLCGCTVKVADLVAQCEATRGPVTLTVKLMPDAKSESDSITNAAALEIKADVRLLSSESQVIMLGTECMPIDDAMSTIAERQKQQHKLFAANNNNSRRVKAKRSYIKLEGSPLGRF